MPFMKFGPRRKPGEMNKTEAAYAAHLETLKQAGDIAAYWFEVMTLRLAKDTRYTPDFLVQLPDGTIEMHEVKGFWRDDARVKIKVAAAMMPIVFRAVTKSKSGWTYEDFT